MDSKELIQRISRGDRTAAGELLALHLPRLRAYVRLRASPLVLARESPSDVVQAVCLEVLESIDRFKWGGEAGFRHWLFETALRKIVDRHAHWVAQKRDVRREARSAGDDSQARELLGELARLTTPSQEAAADEAVESIVRAFRVLNEEQQEVVTLSRLVGLAHTEIADHMGYADPARVRRVLHRGLAALADAMVSGGSSPDENA